VRIAAIAALALSLQGCAGLAVADPYANVEIVHRGTGQAMPLCRHQGRLYVAGTPGERYAVKIANRSSGRVLAVVSVDGINAVTGETAAADQNGYVLHAGQSFEINGWRKSTSEVASFYFTRLTDSYAARTDRPDHVGVIGVAVFREWQRPPQVLQDAPAATSRSARSNESSNDAAGASVPQEAKQAERIGTAHGERERSEVVYTRFRRTGSTPSQVVVIHYDTRANLVARGVISSEPRLVTPNPFPGGGFVPDPRS
jgi:hypothetical protein